VVSRSHSISQVLASGFREGRSRSNTGLRESQKSLSLLSLSHNKTRLNRRARKESGGREWRAELQGRVLLSRRRLCLQAEAEAGVLVCAYTELIGKLS